MKKFKMLTITLVAVMAGIINVNAEELIKTADGLEECLSSKEATCKLGANIVLDINGEITGKITLDLNGYSITPSSAFDADKDGRTRGILIVHNGSSLTVNDSVGTGKISVAETGVYAGIVLTKTGDDATNTATLVINGGTIEGYYYGIAGNGSRPNTNVTITGGTITGTNSAYRMGIFHPQDGTITVKGGTISGMTGIEMRAGTLNVTGGTIIGDAAKLTVNANGSGSTTTGAGIAIAQHNTSKAISVTISGGTVKGYAALSEADPQNNGAEGQKLVTIEVTGGTFEAMNESTAAIVSVNKTGFITGGNFNTVVTNYIKEGYEATSNNGVYTVSKIVPKTEIPTLDPETEVEEVVVGATDSEKTEEVLIESLEGNEELASKVNAESTTVAIEIADVKETDLEEEIIEAMEETAGKATIATYFDITVAVRNTEDGELLGTLSELSDEIELMVLLPEDLKNVDSKIKRTYYVIKRHVDENGKVTIEKLPASLSEDGNSLTFKTSEFSTYALAYEDTANVNEKNPTTSDNAGLYIVLGLVSLVGLAGSVLYVNKKRLSN